MQLANMSVDYNINLTELAADVFEVIGIQLDTYICASLGDRRILFTPGGSMNKPGQSHGQTSSTTSHRWLLPFLIISKEEGQTFRGDGKLVVWRPAI